MRSELSKNLCRLLIPLLLTMQGAAFAHEIEHIHESDTHTCFCKSLFSTDHFNAIANESAPLKPDTAPQTPETKLTKLASYKRQTSYKPRAPPRT